MSSTQQSSSSSTHGSSNDFRLQTKTIFLTYPNLPEEPDITSWKEHFSTILSDYNIIGITIGKEKHQSGKFHIHALIGLGRKLSTRNVRFFDYLEQHPNIQSTRSIAAVRKYCKKEGDFIEEGWIGGAQDSWGDAIKAATKEEFLDIIRREHPEKLVRSWIAIDAYCKAHYPDVTADYVARAGPWMETDVMKRWRQENVGVCIRH